MRAHSLLHDAPFVIRPQCVRAHIFFVHILQPTRILIISKASINTVSERASYEKVGMSKDTTPYPLPMQAHITTFLHLASLLWLARNGYNAQCLAARRIICLHSANSAGSRTVGFS